MQRYIRIPEQNEEATRRRFGGFTMDRATGKVLDQRKPYYGMKRPPRPRCEYCGRRVRGPNHMEHCKGATHGQS
jgi:hypothetical protein